MVTFRRFWKNLFLDGIVMAYFLNVANGKSLEAAPPPDPPSDILDILDILDAPTSAEPSDILTCHGTCTTCTSSGRA